MGPKELHEIGARLCRQEKGPPVVFNVAGTAATQKLERDRDVEAWQATMRRLDAAEAAVCSALVEEIPASKVVEYLRNLPETWRRASGGQGRCKLAESLSSNVRALGFREIEFQLTPHGAALGLAEALPSRGLELRVSGYGRGERSSGHTIQLSIRIEPGSVVNEVDVADASEIA